jgi:hypothetical protein
MEWLLPTSKILLRDTEVVLRVNRPLILKQQSLKGRKAAESGFFIIQGYYNGAGFLLLQSILSFRLCTNSRQCDVDDFSPVC